MYKAQFQNREESNQTALEPLLAYLLDKARAITSQDLRRKELLQQLDEKPC